MAKVSKQAMRGESGRAAVTLQSPEQKAVVDAAFAKIKARVVDRMQVEVKEASNDNDHDDVLYPLYQAVRTEFEQASVALKTLPRDWAPSGLRSGWPDVLREFWDAYGAKGNDLDDIRLRATKEQLDSLDRVLEWIGRLQRQEMQIVLAHTAGMSFRSLARIFGKSPMWVHGQYRQALIVIAFTEINPGLIERARANLAVASGAS